MSLSDENDHKAEAIHAALSPKIKELAQEGFKEITIVSDSPTSQYRNGKSAFLTSKWSVELGVQITWIFTEAGHGKSSADGIGGNIKNLAQDKQNMQPDLVIKTAQDVMDNIETTIEMKVHTKEDIEKVKESMPAKVGTLKKATQIHELVFESDGKIKMKFMPNERNYNQVRIKTGIAIVRKRRVEHVDLNQGFMGEAAEEETNEEEEVETETDRRRMRIRTRSRVARFDDIVADLEDDSHSESDSDTE